MQGGYLKTKKVYVFVNGRDRENYKFFHIHPKSRLGWNAILAIFSTALKPTFGAIRVLRTRDGKTVIDSFDDLKHEGKYVACGLEPFKSIKGGYRTNSELEIKTKPTEYYPTKLLSVDDQKKYPCLIETMRKGRTIIFVFANGKKSVPRKVVLIKSDYKIWDNILIHIGNILDIPEGIKGLCTIFGQPLCSPYEIQHGGYYVAIPCNATFKKIKYLAAKKTDSYHENSPLVTKGAYVSASKTCTSIEGLSGKRRKEKSSNVRERSEEERVRRKTKDQPGTSEYCVCVEGEEEASVKKKRIMEDHKEEKSIYEENVTSEKLDIEPGIEENISTSQDVYIAENQIQSEHQIQSEVYDQNEIFTQTSAVCFESTCDQENAIIMNEKKFFLLTEEQLQHLKESNVDSQPFKLSADSSDYNDPHYAPNREDDMDEIRKVAGHFVGIITKVSEKMIAKSMYGDDYASMDSSQEYSSDNAAGKVFFIPDSLEPRNTSSDISEDRMTKSALSKRSKHLDQVLKSLRLSLPIGRGTSLNEDQPEHEIVPQKRVSLHSPPVEVSDSLMEELHEEYKPLTPAHDMSAKERQSIVPTESDENLGTYIPFFGLRRDSIGIPLISKLYGARKDSDDEDEDEDENEPKEEDNLSGESHQEDEKIDEEEHDDNDDDEWQKLNILEDMDLDDRDKDELQTEFADEEEKHTECEEDENVADLTDEPIEEQNETKEELSQIRAEVEDSAVEEETTSVQPQSPEPLDEETKITVDITSEHSEESKPDDEDVVSAHSRTSDADIEDKKTSEDIVHHPHIQIAEIEDAKTSEDITSDHSENLPEETEETKSSEDIISEHLQIAEAETEETDTSGFMIAVSPEIESSMIEDGAKVEDIISDKSSEAPSDVQEMKTSKDSVSEASQRSIEKAGDTEIDRPIAEEPVDETHKDAEIVISEKPATVVKREEIKATQRESTKAGKKNHMKIDPDQSLTSTKGSSSHYYAQKDLQAPANIYGSLLNASGEIILNEDGSVRGASSSDLQVLTQKSKVGSYCVTLNSWISMKVEECGETIDKNPDSDAGQVKSSKYIKENKNDHKRNVKTEFEEERRRSLLNFMRMRIELALSNKIPELRQPSKPTD